MKPILIQAPDWSYKNPLAWLFGDYTGYNQKKYIEESNKKQIAYDNYLRFANVQAYTQYLKNVGRSLANPGLSYPGAIYRADTGIARSSYDVGLAGSNYRGSLPYRMGGLYGISSRLSRWI